MNLISCDGCGVVLDSNKIKEEYVTDSDGVAISWLDYIVCPICRQQLNRKTGKFSGNATAHDCPGPVHRHDVLDALQRPPDNCSRA